MNPTGNNDRERILASTDIVRLIGEHVQLRPKGREFAGLCPFHDDKNPSMQVSPQKQIYKCFSCGAGGTAFDFVMGYHKLDFREALKMLADRAGIELTPFKGGQGGASADPKSGDRRKRLLAVNELALTFFQKMLQADDAQAIRDYVEKRGISPEMVEQFQMGYAPHSWHALSEAVTAKRLDKPAFEAAGLVANGNRGLYDKLRHRLIFPICDDMGRAIAFGGRTLPGNELDDPTVDAKYLNSPETLLFNKSQTLYGLHLAKKAIIDSKTAVIVEGYTDVVACHQHDRRNVIAALGTAFTAEHATKLRRFCEKVVLVFDGDEAGHKAADRAVEVLLSSEIDVAVVILPDGQDPDELLSAEGGEATWDQLIDNAPGAMQYLLRQFEDQLGQTGTMAGKQDAATAFLTRLSRHDIAQMPAIRRALVIGRLSDLLHLPEQEVVSELKRLKPRTFAPVIDPVEPMYEPEPSVADTYPEGYEPAESFENERPVSDSSSKIKAVTLAERQLIACLLRDNTLFDSAMPDGADFCEAVPPGDVVGPNGEARRVYQLLHDRFADAAQLDLRNVLAELAERGWEAERRWLTEADAEMDALLDAEREPMTKLRLIFDGAAQAIRQANRPRESAMNNLPPQADASAADDPVARALALANQAQSRTEQLKATTNPGKIARVNR